jgi:5-methyltetrahydrofolate--homocysteine methyltransferase
VEKAEAAGIPREDVIIDPLAMAVSADDQAGLETIRALRLIHTTLGVNQTLGLSNISFGLPERASINAAFLAMAVVSGLTCPIADPTAMAMRTAVSASDMLLGRDPFCMRFISLFDRTAEGKEKTGGSPDAAGAGAFESLKEAVIHGRRKRGAELTKAALEQGADPHTLIDDYLIPALNEVGERFEQKKIFIPEMMMAAKTMQACLDLIKPRLRKETQKVLGTVVIGTVFGDLHDIGKNLTKLLLETSGFKVVDLGENVPPERFVAAAREHNAHLVGLSSLLTTGDPHVAETIKTIRESDIADRVKVICGGAAVTLKFVEACGADAYAKDAAEGVKKTKALLGISG